MATQVSARNSCWLDGITAAAQDIRLGTSAIGLTSAGASGTTGIAATAGVRYAVGSPLACVWTSGMTFTLNAGMCWVQGTASAIAGLYDLVLDTSTALIVPASDPTNPRIDSVIAQIVDNGNNTSTFVFKILAGTPAGSPVAPTPPANSLLLCNIAVAANASVLSQGVFTDKRVYSASSGGILPFANTTGATIAGPPGSYVDDLITGRLRRLDGSGNARQAKVAQFAPNMSRTTGSPVAINATSVTLFTTSVTTDGVTEIEIVFGYSLLGGSGSSNAGDSISLVVNVDGSQFPDASATCNVISNGNTTNAGPGVTFHVWGTPNANVHTVTLVATCSSPVSGRGYSLQTPFLRILPSLA